MLKKKYSLVIAQMGVTQFDGPFFRQIAHSRNLNFIVYYTAPLEKAISKIDEEIGLAPVWDNDCTSGYPFKIRDKGIKSAFRYAMEIVHSRPDLLIVSGYMPLYHLLIATYARLRGVSVGLRSDTTLIHSQSISKAARFWMKWFLMRIILRLYSAAHPVGTLAQKYLMYYRFPEDSLFPFPYAVNNAWIEEQKQHYRTNREAIRTEIGILPEVFVALGVLKFTTREDPITLIKGFLKLLQKHPAAHLILIGDGPLRKQIEAMIPKNFCSQFHIPGYVAYSRLPMYYAISDVFVHPPISESWGVSVNEAMACGLPVIVSDRVGSHIDLVRRGKTGFVFRTNSSNSLAYYLALLAKNPTLCQKMGKQAHEHVQKWSYAFTESSLLKAIHKVTKKKRRKKMIKCSTCYSLKCLFDMIKFFFRI